MCFTLIAACSAAKVVEIDQDATRVSQNRLMRFDAPRCIIGLSCSSYIMKWSIRTCAGVMTDYIAFTWRHG